MSKRSLNKVFLIGNLTRDPEVNKTTKGVVVCSFTVATNREWGNEQGEKQEEVEFHRVTTWAKLAEICSNILTKGSKVWVEGYLKTDNWTNKEGQEMHTTKIVAREVLALERGQHEQNEQTKQQTE